MKRIIIIGIISISSLIQFSCSKSNEINSGKKEPAICIECEAKDHNIQLSEPVIIENQKDSLYNSLINSSDFILFNTTRFGQIAGNKMMVSDIVGENGKVIFVKLTQPSGIEAWMIALMLPTSINVFVHEIQVGTTTSRLSEYSSEGTLLLSGIINNSDGKFESVWGIETDANNLTWNKCMQAAWSACMADWQCSMLCALMAPHCLGSMAVACAITVAHHGTVN